RSLRLASGSNDNIIRLWDTDSGKLIRELKIEGEEGWVDSVAFSPDGNILASSGYATIHLWRVSDGQHLQSLGTETVYDVAFSPDGQILASANWGETVRLWRVSDGQVLHNLHEHKGIVIGVDFSSNGNTPAALGSDNVINLWRASDGQSLQTLKRERHTLDVNRVAISPDANIIASVSWDDTVRLWRVSDGQQLHSMYAHKGRADAVAFSPDGRSNCCYR
ncbi:MAG: hypothetical protein B6243_06815, partial [Anaerolineaceae bacterium 4572_5.2]